ncbi:Major facilitator superfamily domain, general substrate transporter [Beauveria brongniartii RCEF 3172]|uniref:Major facilitator superfamily domain, general substrate transporter n=1 Tax=Beauveria brongniartii RCEF 3172 TaxID=1081107 RepID=A0A162JQW7_9HYPO|nr:Major facilitator superfamily domain, general substrate transporter [Beauveria brongniartii RCEF 3172]
MSPTTTATTTATTTTTATATTTTISSQRQQHDIMDEPPSRPSDSVSQSLQATIMPLLDAEPQPALLLPVDHPTTAARTSTGAAANSQDDQRSSLNLANKPDHDNNNSDQKHDDEERSPGETSPLLRRRRDDDAPASAAPPPPPPSLFLGGVSPTRFWLIFAQILGALFIACVDGTVMASSHPVIASHFRAAHAASWLSTAFLLAMTALQPLLGRLSDSLGRKPLFVGGVGLLALGTAGCAVAPTLGAFVAARGVCGVGAGAAIALGSIITSDLVPIERRSSFQALFNATWGAGSAIGAATGGWLAETVGWRWEFGIQVPPLLLIFGASFVAIPDDIGLLGKPAKTVLQALREFDLVGSGLSTATTTALILTLNLGGNILPWSHPIVVASMVVFALSFPAFLWVESRTAKPIMPLHLVTKMPHANLIFGNFLASLLFNAVLFNMQVFNSLNLLFLRLCVLESLTVRPRPLYFQAVLLTSATTSGLRLVVPSVASSVAGIFTGFLITRTRRLRWPLLVGSILTAIGNLVLVLLRRGLAAPLYGLALLPGSLGAGFQLPGSFMALLVASPQPEHAVVTSTVLLWRSLGSVLGVAASSLVLQAGLLHHLRRNVHGDRRDDVIASVRRSVEVVARLEEPYREQVILSYEAALRLTFILTSALALVSFLLMVPIKLKRLPAQK